MTALRFLKLTFHTCLLLICLAPLYSLGQPQESVRLMTFNIRYNNPGDGYNAWPHRVEMVESMIRFHQADVFGVQEALHRQIKDLEAALPEFEWVGVGRDDAATKGEYAAIFFRRGRFQSLESGTFWLSESPEKPGFGWDAHHNRIATWSLFRDKSTQKEFYLLNTHFDHQGEVARRESAKLMLRKIGELPNQKLPVLLMGDFNMTVDSEPYRILTQPAATIHLKDTWLHTMESPHGPASTWSGFAFPGHPEKRIDYIFYRNEVEVIQVGSLSDSWSGRFPSDHLPVLAEVLIDPVQPLSQAHAHNDYEHDRPLLDALAHGFTSFEADIWLIGGELFVSHNSPAENNRKSLSELYLDPLAKWAESQSNRIYPGYDQPVYLMIDMKNSGKEAYEVLKDRLAPYTYLLDHQVGGKRVKGLVRIFISGDRPVAELLTDDGLFAGIDGRPEDLGKGHSAYVMPVVSQNFRKVTSWKGKGEISEKERAKLVALAAATHAEGKRLRLWATPELESCWETLKDCGIDLLNADDLPRLQQFLLSEE